MDKNFLQLNTHVDSITYISNQVKLNKGSMFIIFTDVCWILIETVSENIC